MGEIYGTIRPDILGIVAEDLHTFINNPPKLNDGSCGLTFNNNTNMFVFNTTMNGCGVQLGQVIETGERYIFISTFNRIKSNVFFRFLTVTNSISLPEQVYRPFNVSIPSLS